MSRKSYFTEYLLQRCRLTTYALSLQFIFDRFDYNLKLSEYPFLITIWAFIISLLMISRIPTFSFRNVRFNIARNKAILVLFCLFRSINFYEGDGFSYSLLEYFILLVFLFLFRSEKDTN